MSERLLNYRTYVLILLGLTSVLYVGGAAYMHFVWKDIAPQFTPNPPLNQKMLFLREIWPRKAPATAIIGSSMALNDFDGDLYQAETHTPVINFGANGLSMLEAWRFYQDGRSQFPIGDVILLANFNELRDQERDQFVVPPPTFARYVRGRISWIEELPYRDLQGIWHMVQNRKALLYSRSDYASSDFTPTGSVPLDIYGPAINATRWNAVGLADDGGCRRCGATLAAVCQEAVRGGHDFTLIMPPLTRYIRSHRSDVEARYQRGRGVMKAVMAACGGHMFDAGSVATFDDGCFVDFEHLNARGMRALTELFIQWRRTGTLPPKRSVSCSTPVEVEPSHRADRATT